jgi:hypothetical protein
MSKRTFRFQVIDIRTREPDGDLPHVHPGRALMRAIQLNLFAQEVRYTLRPVRWIDDSVNNQQEKQACSF